MRHAIRLLVIGSAAFALQGCLARTAVSAVTLPVRVASKGVDLATTSQSEADQARGREIRQREQRLARLDAELRQQEDDCLAGNDRACREAVATRREIEQLLPTVPLEPDR